MIAFLAVIAFLGILINSFEHLAQKDSEFALFLIEISEAEKCASVLDSMYATGVWVNEIIDMNCTINSENMLAESGNHSATFFNQHSVQNPEKKGIIIGVEDYDHYRK